MSHTYSLPSCLRHAPNALIARYFHDQNLFRDLDIAQLAETDVAPLLGACAALPDDVRTTIDTDFRLIDTLADPVGLKAILDEANYHGEDLGPVFAQMDGFHEKVLWTFLERHSYLEVAERFAEADRRPESNWLRRKNLPRVIDTDAQAVRDRLADEVRAYFQEQGRGYACLVESFRRDDADWYFVYFEDYAQTIISFDQGQHTRRTHRPAVEVVFVYSPERGTLDTAYQGPRDSVRALNRGFGRAALGVELRDELADDRIYDLDVFKRRDYPFKWEPESGIQSVTVVQFRITHFGDVPGKVTYQVDGKAGADALYAFFEAESRTAADPLRQAQSHVTQVKIRVQFARDGRPGRRTRTFTLTYPNGCSLRHDGRDAVMRKMLIDSGVELVWPTEAAA
jgi:hypothetical protein